MTTPEPDMSEEVDHMAERQYVVGWKRVEYGETVIMAASAAEAERIAFEVIDGPVWTFEAGGYIGKPKARLVRDPAQKRWLTGEGYREAAEPDDQENGDPNARTYEA